MNRLLCPANVLIYFLTFQKSHKFKSLMLILDLTSKMITERKVKSHTQTSFSPKFYDGSS